MRKLEDLMNSMTDMDWGWWPVLSMRPPKDGDIGNRVLLKISPVFGSVLGLLIYLRLVGRQRVAFSVTGLIVYSLLGCVVFFVFYKVTFAFCWNRRARRLRSAAVQNKPVAQTVGSTEPPPAA